MNRESRLQSLSVLVGPTLREELDRLKREGQRRKQSALDHSTRTAKLFGRVIALLTRAPLWF